MNYSTPQINRHLKIVLSDSFHLLYRLLSENKTVSYNVRSRSYNLTLSCKSAFYFSNQIHLAGKNSSKHNQFLSFLLTFQSIRNLRHRNKLVLGLPVLGTTRTWTWRAEKAVQGDSDWQRVLPGWSRRLSIYIHKEGAQSTNRDEGSCQLSHAWPLPWHVKFKFWSCQQPEDWKVNNN